MAITSAALFILSGTGLGLSGIVYAAQGEPFLPPAAQLVPVSSAHNPVTLKGIKFYPNEPFKLEFILDEGNTTFTDSQLKKETNRLIRYFLCALTVPAQDMWVNLSPYESDRIIADDLGTTEIGRDMLAQDYMLKQLSASLTYPENDLGKQYWKTLHGVGANNHSPVNSFNKIWIMPDKSEVYESGTKAIITESSLKIMTEADYLAMQNNSVGANNHSPVKQDAINRVSTSNTDALKQIIIPEITKDVNTGKNFARLRQLHSAIVLAAWFKTRLKDSLYDKLYVNKKKTGGLILEDKTLKDKIYNQYVEAFKKGVYNYIKKESVGANDYSPAKKITKRQYFSGGIIETGEVHTTSGRDAGMWLGLGSMRCFTAFVALSAASGSAFLAGEPLAAAQESTAEEGPVPDKNYYEATHPFSITSEIVHVGKKSMPVTRVQMEAGTIDANLADELSGDVDAKRLLELARESRKDAVDAVENFMQALAAKAGKNGVVRIVVDGNKYDDSRAELAAAIFTRICGILLDDSTISNSDALRIAIGLTGAAVGSQAYVVPLVRYYLGKHGVAVQVVKVRVARDAGAPDAQAPAANDDVLGRMKEAAAQSRGSIIIELSLNDTPPNAFGGMDISFGIGSNGIEGNGTEDHQAYHNEILIGTAMRNIAAQLGLKLVEIKKEGKTFWMYDFAGLFKDDPKRVIVLNGGDTRLYMTPDGIVAIEDKVLTAGHAGRGSYGMWVCGKDAGEIAHELKELRDWRDDALKTGIATADDIAKGLLGRRIDNYGRSHYRELVNKKWEFHIDALLTEREERISAIAENIVKKQAEIASLQATLGAEDKKAQKEKAAAEAIARLEGEIANLNADKEAVYLNIQKRHEQALAAKRRELAAIDDQGMEKSSTNDFSLNIASGADNGNGGNGRKNPVGGITEDGLTVKVKGNGTRIPMLKGTPVDIKNFIGFDFTIRQMKRNQTAKKLIETSAI